MRLSKSRVKCLAAPGKRKYEDKLWTTDVDQGQIGQVLLNLFVNAGQAMPDGGRLHLSTNNITMDDDRAALGMAGIGPMAEGHIQSTTQLGFIWPARSPGHHRFFEPQER